jgi:hypothetical protein
MFVASKEKGDLVSVGLRMPRRLGKHVAGKLCCLASLFRPLCVLYLRPQCQGLSRVNIRASPSEPHLQLRQSDLTDNRPSSVHPSSGVRHALQAPRPQTPRQTVLLLAQRANRAQNAIPRGQPVTGPSQLSQMVRQPAPSSSLPIICHHPFGPMPFSSQSPTWPRRKLTV